MDVPNETMDTTPSHIRVLKDITFGSIAGMVSKVFEHPFDLTKVRLQSQVLDSSARFAGPIDCLRKTWKNEGVRGLYRGLPAPIAGAMVENASLFLSYREFQNIIRRITHQPESQRLPLHQLAIAAAGSGTITSFLLTPIELVKCKMQVQMLIPPSSSSPAHSLPGLPGPFTVLASAFRGAGFTGLWLGHTGTLIRETGGTAAWFVTKEYVASLLLARRTSSSQEDLTLRPWESALSGACAGAAFNLALFPADTVKSAMQTAEELRPELVTAGAPGQPYRYSPPSFFGTFAQMYKAQGIRGLYAGCGITVARSIPSSAIIFLIFDGLNKHFG
ncbi:mitochondrial carrier domain-containing protein [Lentinula aff. detonsa]|uniref:Mitochondrial carrier domain-containing protein n=1 Tax=Lentinula aff. detonsa TaxID=2804958 RepID=A0AA38L435_9AGAR|nr:mitochondrial carrier domain-containing protein [Lentinula aff. detonsa]KAJ3799795.1 mitochondrial carrier domain-containing protein [Lentinula aff. detonsa]